MVQPEPCIKIVRCIVYIHAVMWFNTVCSMSMCCHVVVPDPSMMSELHNGSSHALLP